MSKPHEELYDTYVTPDEIDATEQFEAERQKAYEATSSDPEARSLALTDLAGQVAMRGGAETLLDTTFERVMAAEASTPDTDSPMRYKITTDASGRVRAIALHERIALDTDATKTAMTMASRVPYGRKQNAASWGGNSGGFARR